MLFKESISCQKEEEKNYHRLFSSESREGGGTGEENQLPLLDGVGGRVLEEGQSGGTSGWLKVRRYSQRV